MAGLAKLEALNPLNKLGVSKVVNFVPRQIDKQVQRLVGIEKGSAMAGLPAPSELMGGKPITAISQMGLPEDQKQKLG